MTKITAGITISLDGYVTGPNDGPGIGLGEGGERLHYWVFGGPWTYRSEQGKPADVDEQYLDEVFTSGAAWIVGRTMHDVVDELTLTIAPVLLGAGKRLFDGIARTDTAFERFAVIESPFATHLRFRVEAESA